MARKAHPNKEVEKALRYAEKEGWVIKVGGAHCWGKLCCPKNTKDCRLGRFCFQSIYSTPRNTYNHAKMIRRVVDGCIHPKDE
ncbi:MAG: hypothetical protein AAGN15_16575 [Cyanobacteria bacterium J06581_3]